MNNARKEKIVNHLKQMDWILILCTAVLIGFGLVYIYSSSFPKADFLSFKKQCIFFVAGFFMMLIISFIDWRIFRDSPYLILALYAFNILTLAFLFFFAPEIKGIKGWYRIGPILVDPVGPLRIILIILLSKYFSERHIEMYNIKHILISAIYVAIPFSLIALQPDLGSALILLFLWLGILVVSGIRTMHFFILLFCFILLFVISWNHFLRPYQQERILSFLMPQSEPLGAGWSQSQSRIAIGSGGIWGKGFRRGTQVQLGFLTLPQTDFVFSAIAEEFGFVGVLILFFLISVLFLRIVKIALNCKTNFPRLFALGFSILFISQSFVHIGMNLGLLPVIGISLPLVGYGGSDLLSNILAIGILQGLVVYGEK